MLASLIFVVLGGTLIDPPKQPLFDITAMCKVVDLREANEMKVRQENYRDMPRWTRLFGVEIPKAGQTGYSGARQDLELLLGRSPDVYVEDEREEHPVVRNATWVQYVWTQGKLLQFELVRDGWATVNDEGARGRYGKYLKAAEVEAKKFHEGLWAIPKN
jgi:endonuclease YncB( thermonuclease family)